MVQAPDFDRKMLLLATELSHESDMKALLLSVLEALLKTLKFGVSEDTVIDAMTLLRCIIRLTLNLLVEPAAKKSVRKWWLRLTSAYLAFQARINSYLD